MARTDATPAIRGEAIFWLGQKAGRKAAADITERIEEIVRNVTQKELDLIVKLGYVLGGLFGGNR